MKFNRYLKLKILLFAFFLIVVAVHLKFFGFHLGDDGPRWIAMTKFFLGQNSAGQVWYHVALNPIFSLISLPFYYLGLGIKESCELVNLGSLFATTLVFISLTKKLTKNFLLAIVSGCLFLIDYQTLRQTFMVYPDIFSWLTTVVILNFVVDLWLNKKQNSLVQGVVWGILLSFATLLKTNLGFLFPLYPLIMYLKKDKKLLSCSIVTLGILGLILGFYYLWIWQTYSHLPWDQMVENQRRLGAIPIRQLFEFIPTYLYLFPLIIIGIFHYPFRFPRRLIMALFVTTCLPVFLWPYSGARFNFSTFWFFLPLASAGLVILTKKRKILITIVILGLLILSNLRLVMTLQDQTHLEFFKSLSSHF